MHDGFHYKFWSISLKRLGCLAALAITLSLAAGAQKQPPPSRPAQPTPSPTPAQDVPVIDGNAGPCSVMFTVTDASGKAQYPATVKVHIAYGFAGIRKLDLEAGTNLDGKVKFKGLPLKVHNPPLEFKASKDQLTGAATYNPATECDAQHDIIVEQKAVPGY